MERNPLIERVAALQRQYESTCSELSTWRSRLDWFNGFDTEEASANLRNAERMNASAQGEHQQALAQLACLQLSVAALEGEVELGMNPRYWFSAERAIAKRQLTASRQSLIEQRSDVASIETRSLKAADLARDTRAYIARARAFDPLLAASAISALQGTKVRLEPELARLRKRCDEFDELLSEPLESLRKQEAERDQIKARIVQAQDFDAAIENASDGRERAHIHARCDRELGDSSPAVVLKQNRGALRRVEVNISKLEARIQKIVGYEHRDIRHVVIDGNNLCYSDGTPLDSTLSALEVLVPSLAEKYKVSLIFDAGIVGLVKARVKDRGEFIKRRFPEAVVHIVQSSTTADETILALAQDDTRTYVLSNDKFADYCEKAVVKEGRLIRHDIVPPWIFVHELHFSAKFGA